MVPLRMRSAVLAVNQGPPRCCGTTLKRKAQDGGDSVFQLPVDRGADRTFEEAFKQSSFGTKKFCPTRNTQATLSTPSTALATGQNSIFRRYSFDARINLQRKKDDAGYLLRWLPPNPNGDIWAYWAYRQRCQERSRHGRCGFRSSANRKDSRQHGRFRRPVR